MRQGMSQVTPSCFVAGTMILTAMGLVAIETIKAGDKVISTNPETMETVLETYIREVTTLVHLTVNGAEIITMENCKIKLEESALWIIKCELCQKNLKIQLLVKK
jgi:hypothetical protein